jgi:hypothetical protein
VTTEEISRYASNKQTNTTHPDGGNSPTLGKTPEEAASMGIINSMHALVGGYGLLLLRRSNEQKVRFPAAAASLSGGVVVW